MSGGYWKNSIGEEAAEDGVGIRLVDDGDIDGAREVVEIILAAGEFGDSLLGEHRSGGGIAEDDRFGAIESLVVGEVEGDAVLEIIGWGVGQGHLGGGEEVC